MPRACTFSSTEAVVIQAVDPLRQVADAVGVQSRTAQDSAVAATPQSGPVTPGRRS